MRNIEFNYSMSLLAEDVYFAARFLIRNFTMPGRHHRVVVAESQVFTKRDFAIRVGIIGDPPTVPPC